jgi:hypothetical protein
MEMKMIRLQRKQRLIPIQKAETTQIVETLYKIILFQNDGLRFGGLIGEDRNPARFLAGKENLDNPNAINLIHQKIVLVLSCKSLLSKLEYYL